MAEAGRAAEISDVSIDNLLFDVRTRGKHGLSTPVADAITGGHLEQTIVGSSALTLDLRDAKYALLNSGLFGTRVLCRLDGVDYRMTTVSLTEDQHLRVLFELAVIAEMREHTRPLKAKRSTTTRAEFILMMLRELKLPHTFVSPELHVKQTISASDAEIASATEAAANTPTPTAKESTAESGRAPSVSHSLTVKGSKITDKQSKILSEALAAASQNGASTLSAEALVVALIWENTVDLSNPGSPGDRGPLSLIDSTVAGIQKSDGHGHINPYDIGEVVAHFCTAGFYGRGGSNALAKAHPSAPPSQIGSEVQGPAVPYSSQWDGEAKAIVKDYEGGGLNSFTGTGTEAAPTATTATSEYEYSRGRPGLPEDTFTCGLRLAEEVGWRFFVVARKSNRPAVYFVTEDDLMRAKPRYLIDPQTVGAGKLTFDVETGKRLVVIRGHRQPKPSEARLQVRMDRWDAPPGTVIELADYGPASQKWLVDTVERDLYSAEGTVHLKTPAKSLPEPLKGTVGSGSAGTAEGPGKGGPEATSAQKSKLASEHPELHQGVREVVAAILAKFTTLTITSTLRPGDGHSYHSLGRACDIAGDSQTMATAAQWIASQFTSVLVEGIHQNGLSVKEGKTVDPSFWGAQTWAEHINHIHVAV